MRHWTCPLLVAWVSRRSEMWIFCGRSLSYRSAEPVDDWKNVVASSCQHTKGLKKTMISIRLDDWVIINRATSYIFDNFFFFYLNWPVCLRFNKIKTEIAPMMSTKTTHRLMIKGREVSAKKYNKFKGRHKHKKQLFNHQLN